MIEDFDFKLNETEMIQELMLKRLSTSCVDNQSFQGERPSRLTRRKSFKLLEISVLGSEERKVHGY